MSQAMLGERHQASWMCATRSDAQYVHSESSSKALERFPLTRSRSVSKRLSIDILRVSFVLARARWTLVVSWRLTSSFLYISPNSKTIWSIIFCGSHSGNVHGEIVVWLPVVRNLSSLFGFNRLSRRAHTGQHLLDTPRICLVICIIKFDKDLRRNENVTHFKFT